MTFRGVQYKPILALNGVFIDYVDCQIFLGKCAMDLLLLVHVLSVLIFFVLLN